MIAIARVSRLKLGNPEKKKVLQLGLLIVIREVEIFIHDTKNYP